MKQDHLIQIVRVLAITSLSVSARAGSLGNWNVIDIHCDSIIEMLSSSTPMMLSDLNNDDDVLLRLDFSDPNDVHQLMKDYNSTLHKFNLRGFVLVGNISVHHSLLEPRLSNSEIISYAGQHPLSVIAMIDPSTLRMLQLSGGELSNALLSGIVKFQALQEIVLIMKSPERSDQPLNLAHLSSLKALRSIHLYSEVNLKDLVDALSKCDDLQKATVAVQRSYSSSDIKLLVSLDRLESLDLGGSGVDPYALTPLRGNSRIKSLGLRGCSLDSKDVEIISTMKLSALDIRGAFISEVDMQMLRSSLPDCNILE